MIAQFSAQYKFCWPCGASDSFFASELKYRFNKNYMYEKLFSNVNIRISCAMHFPQKGCVFKLKVYKKIFEIKKCRVSAKHLKLLQV